MGYGILVALLWIAAIALAEWDKVAVRDLRKRSTYTYVSSYDHSAVYPWYIGMTVTACIVTLAIVLVTIILSATMYSDAYTVKSIDKQTVIYQEQVDTLLPKVNAKLAEYTMFAENTKGGAIVNVPPSLRGDVVFVEAVKNISEYNKQIYALRLRRADLSIKINMNWRAARYWAIWRWSVPAEFQQR